MPELKRAVADQDLYTCRYKGALYEIPRPETQDIIDVDADHLPASDTAYERTSAVVVVRGLGPTDRVTLGGLGPDRAAIGEAARLLFGLAMRGNAGNDAAQSTNLPEDLTAAHALEAHKAGRSREPYAARTERLTMVPGLTGVILIHHNGHPQMLRIFSEKRLDFLLGVSGSLDFNLLSNRPFGSVTLGDKIGDSQTRELVFTPDPLLAATFHALIGVRLRDTALWLGSPLFSTTGGMLSGAELHVGMRRPSFSQATYLGVYGALRWASRQRTEGFTGDDNIDHLPRDWKFTFTFGIELQFDLLALAGGHDGLVNAFSSQ